ncbi:MAG: TldD/PmbA family protein [Chloroflexi bacterium]|nr:TldD/PmbA family protein [Chloroflexota bacterium]
MLERLLERAKQVAQEAEAFHVERRETPVVFEANRLKAVETHETEGVALRVIKEGRIGFSSANTTSDVEGLVARAVEVAPFGARAYLDLPSAQSYPEVRVHDSAVSQVPIDEMVHLGQTLIDRVRDHSQEVLCDSRVVRSEATVTLANTRGCYFQYSRTVFAVAIEGTVIRGTDMLFLFDYLSSCHPIRDVAPLAESLVQQLERSQVVAPVQSGSMPVVFMPWAVIGGLLPPLLAGLNGRMVLQRTSPLVDRLGERVVAEQFSLMDNPTHEYVPSSRPCDDEGIPSQQTPLIQQGVVTNFLYDLQTAGQARRRSTSSAERGSGSLPTPSSSVLLVSPGQHSFDDMVKDMEVGLVVERLLGAGQSNILGGEFNANVLLGYKVERGKMVGRVKDTLVSGNVYQALSRLEGLGREARWVGGMAQVPPLYFKELSVAAKG